MAGVVFVRDRRARLAGVVRVAGQARSAVDARLGGLVDGRSDGEPSALEL